jgi:ABC-type glycerol-3-phosphate transport system permease component
MKISGFASIPRHILLGILTVIARAPLIFMVLTSVKSPDEYSVNPAGLPKSITFDNYTHALVDLPTLRWAMNSLIVTVVAVIISTVVGAMAAYAISFGNFRGRTTLLSGSIAAIMVPPVVLVVPMFVTMVNLKLINTLGSVIIFYSCLLVPFCIFFLYNFFRTVPSELVEAAVVDGAGPIRTLFSVVVPLAKPALVTVAVVNTIWAWNELLIALVFLQDEKSRTLMAGMTLLQGRYVTNQPLVLAVATLSILPVALFYLLSQRAFVRGLTAGIGK